MVPLELAAGLIEGATPALAFSVAHGYGQHDMRLHGRMLSVRPYASTTSNRSTLLAALARVFDRRAANRK